MLDADVRIVDDVSAPARTGAMLADDPGPLAVELRGHGHAAGLPALAPGGLQLGGHRGAQPQPAHGFHRWVEQIAPDSAFPPELPQRLLVVRVRHASSPHPKYVRP